MTSKEVSRNKSYELILSSLYSALIFINMKEEVDIKKILSDAFNSSYEEVPLIAKEIMIYALKELNEVIDIFQHHMDTWKFSRIEKTIQAILIMSYINFYKVGNIDKAIVINIAVKLAKKYGDDKDYKFVNAILDKVLQ